MEEFIQPAQLGALVSWRALAEKGLALALAVASHPVVFWPMVLLVSAWLCVELAFYFYLRYIVLPELNRLTKPVESVHTSWDQFHKIIDLVARLKGVSEQMDGVAGGGSWWLNKNMASSSAVRSPASVSSISRASTTSPASSAAGS